MADHRRLDEALDSRRLDLGLSWVQLAALAGVSDVSMRNFRKGRTAPGSLSKRRIEDALRWAPGSIDAVLEGKEPTLADGGAAPARATPQEIRQLIAEAQDELRWLNPKYESTRRVISERLERQIAELQRQLDAMHNGDI